MKITVLRPPKASEWWDAVAFNIEGWLRRVLTSAMEPRKYTVATLPDAASNEGLTVYVSDESGGATLAFSDGTDWRRAQDRNVVS